MPKLPHVLPVAKLPDDAAADPLDPSFANLIVRFPKIWEDFVDVQWSRQIFDGRRIVKYHLVAEAAGYRVERYFQPNESTFRLAGLAPDTEVDVRVRMQLETKAEGEIWKGWACSVVRSLMSASIDVLSVKPHLLHGLVTWGSELVEAGPTETHAAVPAQTFRVDVEQRGRVLATKCAAASSTPRTGRNSSSTTSTPTPRSTSRSAPSLCLATSAAGACRSAS